jgi:hypothetical protein
MILLRLSNTDLRSAIRRNLVSFPSEIPVFPKQTRCDIQWRIVQLYFVRGWRLEEIAPRFELCRERVRQILNSWRVQAIHSGYIQPIDPERFLLDREWNRPEPEASLPIAPMHVPSPAAQASHLAGGW